MALPFGGITPSPALALCTQVAALRARRAAEQEQLQQQQAAFCRTPTLGGALGDDYAPPVDDEELLEVCVQAVMVPPMPCSCALPGARAPRVPGTLPRASARRLSGALPRACAWHVSGASALRVPGALPRACMSWCMHP